MRRKTRATLSAGVILALAVGLVVTAIGPAFAAAPPWEQDANAQPPYGNIVLYDAAGNVVTGGNDLTHLADYAAATTGPDAGANKATLYFAAPDHTKVTGLWTAGSASASTTFPNAAAPAPIGTGFANPLVTLSASDANLANFIATIASPDTTAGYDNIWQLRIKDTGPGGVSSGTHYWSADVLVNPSAGTWSMVWPSLTTTTTSITTNPPDGGNAVSGSNVTMTATVTPAEDGNIQFFDGATPVGSPQAVTTSGGTTGVVTDTAPADGVHHYTAQFTPTGGTPVVGSTSPQSTVTIHPPQIGTSTGLSANPTTQYQFQPVDLTADVSEADATQTGLHGTVTFKEGPSGGPYSATIGTQSTETSTPGEYMLTTSSLGQGTHYIVAMFHPNNNGYADSTSPEVVVTIQAPQGCSLPGSSCTDQQTIQVTVNAGTLTISTPYTSTNPFVLPAMQLSSNGQYLSSTAQFPAATDPGIIVTSTLAGNPDWTVSVSGTDLTNGSHTINGTGLGLTGGTCDSTCNASHTSFPGTVTFTDNFGHNPSLADGYVGIKGGPFTFAQSSGGGNGTAQMTGQLTLYAPTSTVAGTYTGTITFTVG